jgi:hypothetical protein
MADAKSPSKNIPTPRAAVLCQSSLGRPIWVQNSKLMPFIQKPWSETLKADLLNLLKDTLEIPLTARGLVQASNRLESEERDSTNYDAVWVRDTVWVFKALLAEGSMQDAKAMVVALLDYFGSDAQLARLDKVIATPECIQGSAGPMEVLHIRFDGRSETFNDVHVNGEPQFWNHKQNDALGIFYSSVAEYLESGLLKPEDLNSSHWKFLTRLPTYFERIEFYNMPDAGAWEELERINTSSIALVTDGLEKWKKLIESSEVVRTAISKQGVSYSDEVLGHSSRLSKLLDQGYQRIHAQIPFESPSHEAESLQFRKSDAALLSLLAPCQLERVTTSQLLSTLASVDLLCGPRGVRRYFNDAYQSGNYWIKGVQEAGLEGTDAWTDDCSAPEDFQKRTSHMLRGTEAQWFFDSWICYGISQLLKRSDLTAEQRSQLVEQRLHHLHRSLGQITGGTESNPEIGADGKRVAAWACPESYNTVVLGDGIRRFAPSPITPLNWAKASLRLAISAIE